jgi:pyruvate,water dikinase
VKKHLQEKQKLEGKKIIELAEICKKLESHYRFPQDIEFGIEKEKIFILQTRPITTI